LKYGEGTNIRYDFSHIEGAILQKLVLGKHLIDIQGALSVPVGKQLISMEKVEILRHSTQVSLLPAILNEIQERLRMNGSLAFALATLENAISFLSSTGPKPEQLVRDFLQKVLQIPPEDALLIALGDRYVQVQHVLCLWRELDHKQAVFVLQSQQDAFETTADEFKKPLSQAAKTAVAAALPSILNRRQVAMSLREVILLRLPLLMGMAQEDRLRFDIPLVHYLGEIDDGGDWLGIPQTVLLENIVETWKMLV
jgi:hypothetical protein